MLKIQVAENTYIGSDSLQYIIKKYTGATDKEGKEISTSLGYFTTLNATLKYLTQMKLKESEATNIKELLIDLKRIEQEIDDLLHV